MRTMPMATALRKARLLLSEWEGVGRLTDTQALFVARLRDAISDLTAGECYQDTIDTLRQFCVLAGNCTIEGYDDAE